MVRFVWHAALVLPSLLVLPLLDQGPSLANGAAKPSTPFTGRVSGAFLPTPVVGTTPPGQNTDAIGGSPVLSQGNPAGASTAAGGGVMP